MSGFGIQFLHVTVSIEMYWKCKKVKKQQHKQSALLCWGGVAAGTISELGKTLLDTVVIWVEQFLLLPVGKFELLYILYISPYWTCNVRLMGEVSLQPTNTSLQIHFLLVSDTNLLSVIESLLYYSSWKVNQRHGKHTAKHGVSQPMK